MDSETKNDETIKPKVKEMEKEVKPGVVYLSRIPTKMNVKILRDYLSEHGEIGRIYLQPTEKKRKNKVIRTFTEGWVEFLNKKHAKRVAKRLNNQPVRGKRRNPWFDELWNIKYLRKFSWTHINERMVYENEVRKQRLKQEVDLAKKETNFYIQNVGKSEKRKRLDKKNPQHNDENENGINEKSANATNNDNDDDYVDEESFKKKRVQFEHKIKVKNNDSFLKQIFS